MPLFSSSSVRVRLLQRPTHRRGLRRGGGEGSEGWATLRYAVGARAGSRGGRDGCGQCAGCARRMRAAAAHSQPRTVCACGMGQGSWRGRPVCRAARAGAGAGAGRGGRAPPQWPRRRRSAASARKVWARRAASPPRPSASSLGLRWRPQARHPRARCARAAARRAGPSDAAARVPRRRAARCRAQSCAAHGGISRRICTWVTATTPYSPGRLPAQKMGEGGRCPDEAVRSALRPAPGSPCPICRARQASGQMQWPWWGAGVARARTMVAIVLHWLLVGANRTLAEKYVYAGKPSAGSTTSGR